MQARDDLAPRCLYAGAHPDLFGDVSLDEAKDVARLTETLVELLYVTPAKIAQRQAGRLT